MTDFDTQEAIQAEAAAEAKASRKHRDLARIANERQFDELQKWPWLKAKNSVLPVHFMRALVFGLSAKTAAKARAVPAADDITDTSSGASVRYYGEPLLQADLRVLLGLVQLAAGKSVEDFIHFDAVDFLQSIGRATCSRSVDALEQSIVKLSSATLHVRNHARSTGSTFGLVERSGAVPFRVGHDFTIRLARGLRESLSSFHEIYVDMSIRNKLSDGVQTALADLLRSTTAESYDVAALATLWGRSDARELGREVRAALDRLVEVGFLASWSKTRGRFHVVRAA